MDSKIVLPAALFFVVISVSPSSGKETKEPSLLTLERIYGTDEFKSEGYSACWLADGSAYTTLEDSPDVPEGRDVVRHDAETGESTIMVDAADLIPSGESAPLKIDGYSWSEDLSLLLVYTNSKRVWRQNTRGDYWLLDRSARQLRKLGGDAPPSTLMFAKISPTGRHVAYVRERDIYLEDLLDGTIKRLTRADHGDVINGTFDWVYEEELRLRDGFRWSPDGKSIAYWQIDTRRVPEFPLVNNTGTLYPRINWIPYPKVGQRNPACRVGVVAIPGGKTRWIDVPGDARNHYIARMEWAESSEEVLLQRLNRLQNTNRVMLADVRTGDVKTILTERDEAWVDVHDELEWLDGGKQFTWISERDGWRHVYVVSRCGKPVTLATPGDYDVIRLLHVDEPNGCLYFIASPENPNQRYLHRIRLDGTGLERLTPGESQGTHHYRISSNARWAIHSESSFDSPPTTDLVGLPEHDTVRMLMKNKKLHRKVQKLRRRPTEFFRVDIGEGVLLDGWCIKPPSLNVARQYPLLVYVYGEPAGQTVVDRWGGKSYLWHLMLAQRGYLVMSFDNRGTAAPRGRGWRKCVYRQIGVLAPQDQAAALRAVIGQRSYVDADRIGIWGASGGGSMSLNAIFKYPELYKTAIAISAVPNQRYYDTIYQERYMGLPSDNVDGFRNGSPINFARQLDGNLLLIHGTGDDNCHYQTTEMLINELIRHNKPFTMMAYPNRTHAIREGKNTTRHMRELMTRYLSENLPSDGEARRRSRTAHDKAARRDLK